MTSRPFFSVIIPTYNRAGFIGDAIESVLNQQFQDFEIIVVDDGSTDNTANVVKQYDSDKIIYYRKDNAERGAARNFGAKKANGIYVNFLDSDDVVYAHHLKTAFDYLKKNSNGAILHLAYDIKNESRDTLRTFSGIRNINDEIISGNVLSCNGVFINRDIFLNNMFNEDRVLASLEGWELWLRMSSRYKFHSCNVVTSTILQHDSRSVMFQDDKYIKEKVERFINCVLADNDNNKYYGKELRKTVASANTYASLHILMANGSKREAIRYLVNGANHNINELFKRRFLVIMKMLLKI